jgi:hypothetical protein
MKIMYEVEDGYVGKARPHYVEVPDQDLEECETYEDKVKLIDECIDENFSQKIYPVWDRTQLK